MLHILLVTTRYGPRHFTTSTWKDAHRAQKKIKEKVYAGRRVWEAPGQTYVQPKGWQLCGTNIHTQLSHKLGIGSVKEW